MENPTHASIIDIRRFRVRVRVKIRTNDRISNQRKRSSGNDKVVGEGTYRRRKTTTESENVTILDRRAFSVKGFLLGFRISWHSLSLSLKLGPTIESQINGNDRRETIRWSQKVPTDEGRQQQRERECYNSRSPRFLGERFPARVSHFSTLSLSKNLLSLSDSLFVLFLVLFLAL